MTIPAGAVETLDINDKRFPELIREYLNGHFCHFSVPCNLGMNSMNHGLCKCILFGLECFNHNRVNAELNSQDLDSHVSSMV